MSAMGDRWAVLLVLVALIAFLEGAAALKCRTEDGPSSDEVRKVIRVCMRQISTEAENKSSDEYEDYDSSYSDVDSDEEEDKNGGKQSGGTHQNRDAGKGRNGDDRKEGSRSSGRNDDHRMGDGRNRKESNDHDRDRDWDYYGHGMGRRSGDGRSQPSGRHKRQYYNDGSQGSYGYSYQQNDRYNRDRENFMNPGSNNSTNSTENPERDRACLMQCFFQEMKMTNNEGFPDKHKVLHVITNDLRDHELKDFYIDSIQECFHMIGMDNKLKDKCDYTMKFVTCLAERGQANCNDWENETIMF